MNPEDMTADDLLRDKNMRIERLAAELDALKSISGMTISQIHETIQAKDTQIEYFRRRVTELESRLNQEAGRDR